MNDRFLIVKHMKQFIYEIDNIVVNMPNKDKVIKDRIYSDSLDILELIYIANSLNNSKNEKIRILSKLSMLDFYFERSYKKGFISEKTLKKYTNVLANITKLTYGWIRNDSKCS